MSNLPPGVFSDHWYLPGATSGTAVVLPGKGYPPAAPLLAYAGYSLVAAGWVVRDVWWGPSSRLDAAGSFAYVEDHLKAVADGVEGRVLVVGKSFGSLGCRLAAERSYPAIWLTPLLNMPEVVDAIRSNPARQLLVGGTGDGLWDREAAAGLRAAGCDVLEIEGADHSMAYPRDAVRTAEVLVEITRAMVAFVAS